MDQTDIGGFWQHDTDSSGISGREPGGRQLALVGFDDDRPLRNARDAEAAHPMQPELQLLHQRREAP